MDNRADASHDVVTLSQLERDLRSIGVRSGQAVMIHVSVRAIGWLVGGPDVLIQALLNSVRASGTVMAYAGWEERPEQFAEWSDAQKVAFLAECPPFDPRTSRANRRWSIITEYLRTWPGACRSANPGASMVAVGAKARFLTKAHPLQYGYGPGSPLDKLCTLDGQVLQIGVAPETLTLLHHAEHLAQIPNKRVFRYKAPLRRGKRTEWVQIEEFDTGAPVVPWAGGDYFQAIACEFRRGGLGTTGQIGNAESFYCKARELRDFALAWMARNLS